MASTAASSSPPIGCGSHVAKSSSTCQFPSSRLIGYVGSRSIFGDCISHHQGLRWKPSTVLFAFFGSPVDILPIERLAIG